MKLSLGKEACLLNTLRIPTAFCCIAGGKSKEKIPSPHDPSGCRVPGVLRTSSLGKHNQHLSLLNKAPLTNQNTILPKFTLGGGNELTGLPGVCLGHPKSAKDDDVSIAA